MKKLLLCALLPICTYAAESKITPASFDEKGKKLFAGYINLWTTAAEKIGIPADKGLAKVFYDIQKDGLDKILNDGSIMQKMNEYHHEYQASPSAYIESALKGIKPNENGNYSFPGIREALFDRLVVNRELEFYNILHKRKESLIMPDSKLVSFYANIANATQLLNLNEHNDTLSPKAITAITLLAVYYRQQDHVHLNQ